MNTKIPGMLLFNVVFVVHVVQKSARVWLVIFAKGASSFILATRTNTR